MPERFTVGFQSLFSEEQISPVLQAIFGCAILVVKWMVGGA